MIDRVLSFPGGSDGKESACDAETRVRSLGQEDLLEKGNGNPLQYSRLEKSHEQRNLLGCNPWGRKESDMTERFHFLFH